MYAINKLSSENYTSAFSDPRLISQSGHRLLLDAPVLDGSVKMANVYEDRYPSVYTSLTDITGGNIRYYYDSDLLVPFFSPLFDECNALKMPYIDPMGSYKPHYTILQKPISTGLTWLSDTQINRNDIIASNLWKRNQTEPLLKPINSW